MEGDISVQTQMTKVVMTVNKAFPEIFLWDGATAADEAAGKYQALYHLMVASSYANKLAHEMIPDVKIGTMLALYGIYPNTCHPDDVFGAYLFRRRALLFSDVMMRGY